MTHVLGMQKEEITSRRMKWVGHLACMGEMRIEGKRSVGRPSYRWEDNIGLNFREIG